MKVLISESQYYRLFETTDLESGETNYINYLCQKKEGYDNLPYCELYKYWSELKISKDKESLIQSVKVLFEKHSRLGNGVLPKIIKLALGTNNPTQYLETISNFINNKKFDDDETKKRLSNLDSETSYDDLDAELTRARNRVYQEYENSFVGEDKVFDKHSTYVNLDYRSNRLNEESFFELVKIIKNDESKLEEISNKIIENIDGSIKNFITDTTKMKADVKTKESLKLSGGSEIFSANTYFEIKKFSPNVDSHLSEFFSIFKQSDLISEKPEYLPTYNKLITTIYTKIKDRYNKFLKDIKSKIGGIILDNYTIIKIEDVDLYWSFLGQRKYEYRLSIRYQIKSGEKIAYKCDPNTHILEEVIIDPKSNERMGVII